MPFLLKKNMRKLLLLTPLFISINILSQDDFISYDSVMTNLTKDYYIDEVDYKNPLYKKQDGWYINLRRGKGAIQYWSYPKKEFKELELKSRSVLHKEYIQSDTFDLMRFYGYPDWSKDALSYYKSKNDLDDKDKFNYALSLIVSARGNNNIGNSKTYSSTSINSIKISEKDLKEYSNKTDSALNFLNQISNKEFKGISVGYIRDYETFFNFLIQSEYQSEKKLLKTLPEDLFQTFGGLYIKNTLQNCNENSVLFVDNDYDEFAALYFQKKHNLKPTVAIVNAEKLNNTIYVSNLIKRYKRINDGLYLSLKEIETLKNNYLPVKSSYGVNPISLTNVINEFKASSKDKSSYSKGYTLKASSVQLNNIIFANLSYSLYLRQIIELNIAYTYIDNGIQYVLPSKLFKSSQYENLGFGLRVGSKKDSYKSSIDPITVAQEFSDANIKIGEYLTKDDKNKLNSYFAVLNTLLYNFKSSNNKDDIVKLTNVYSNIPLSLIKSDNHKYKVIEYYTIADQREKAKELLNYLIEDYKQTESKNRRRDKFNSYRVVSISKNYSFYELEDILYKNKIYDQGYFKPFQVNGKFGFENRNHTELIPPVYDYVEEFSSDMAKIIINQKIGYIDYENNYIITPEYDDVTIFKGSYRSQAKYIVKKDGLMGIIGNEGNIVLNVEYNDLKQINEYGYNNYVIAQKDGKYGMYSFEKYSDNIKLIIPFEYNDILLKPGKNTRDKYFVATNDKALDYYNKEGIKLDPEVFNNSQNTNQITSEEYLEIEEVETSPFGDDAGSGSTQVEEVYEFVEKQPEFPGGVQKMHDFFKTNIKYPQAAIDNNIQGKVYVKFEVLKTGDIGDVMVVRGIHKLLDDEAVRVIKSMPKWIPGEQRGKKVSVWYTVPISFTLDNKNK